MRSSLIIINGKSCGWGQLRVKEFSDSFIIIFFFSISKWWEIQTNKQTKKKTEFQIVIFYLFTFIWHTLKILFWYYSNKKKCRYYKPFNVFLSTSFHRFNFFVSNFILSSKCNLKSFFFFHLYIIISTFEMYRTWLSFVLAVVLKKKIVLWRAG